MNRFFDPWDFNEGRVTEPTWELPKPATLKERRIRDGVCPECGDRGTWVAMACVCPIHGAFLGA